jgi:hypothetical protein
MQEQEKKYLITPNSEIDKRIKSFKSEFGRGQLWEFINNFVILASNLGDIEMYSDPSILNIYACFKNNQALRTEDLVLLAALINEYENAGKRRDD